MSQFTDEELDESVVGPEELARQIEQAPQLGLCLRSYMDAELDSLSWSDFSLQVTERIEIQSEEIDFRVIGNAVRAQSHDEIEQREGQWSAFTQRVLDEAWRVSSQAARQPLEVQALNQLEGDIESTLDGIEPDFEHRFYAQLQGRLVKAPFSPRRYLQRIGEWFRPPQWAWGSLAVAMTVAFAWVNLAPSDKPMVPVSPASALSVRVDAIQFEGTVTLSQSEDVTVIWLASASG